jgi:hypothetical protein
MLFWVSCGSPPLNLRGGVEGLLSAPVWTKRSVRQEALHCPQERIGSIPWVLRYSECYG